MSTSTLQNVNWRKRSLELDSPVPNKRSYWYRLESSESSSANTDETESVYSVQDKETDVVRDTSDTANSDDDVSEYDVDIEYEIASLSEDDGATIIFGSSDESEGMLYAAAAAVIGDSSLETFITDGEDSDNSLDDSSSGLADFMICIQCKSRNDNPLYPFCEKCFQARKALFPPRPKPRKKAERNKGKYSAPVKLEALESCLSGISAQDSGIGSSQEFGSLSVCVQMNFVIPDQAAKNRKRQMSESSLSDEYEAPSKKMKKENSGIACVKKSEDGKSASAAARTIEEAPKGPLPELKEDCITCNTKPKNSVFLHGRIAHMCCCYSCAMNCWKQLKRCPICNRRISNVVRVFTT